MKPIILIVSLYIVCIININIVKADFFSDFWKPVFTNAPKFSSSKLYSIDDIGFNGYNGIVMAFGDFNADKYLDTFFLYENKSTLQVFLWNVENWKYEASDIIVHFEEGIRINNVVGGDFTYDGSLDILIQYRIVNTTDNGTIIGYSQENFMSLCPGYYTSVDEPIEIYGGNVNNKVIPSDQVLVLDANGDLRLDMLGLSTNGVGQRTLWINNDGSDDEDLYYSMDAPQNNPLQPDAQISTPHSNSFIDLNGDCLADLFITSKVLGQDSLIGEFWINNKESGYSLVTTLNFPPGTGQITFADFDNDGDLDMIYPVLNTNNETNIINEIYIVFNNQKPVCASSLFSSAACIPQNQLCTTDGTFSFSNTLDDSDGVTIILSNDQFNGSLFYSDIENGIPLIIHSGDYNIDGFPDILISLIDPNNLEAGPHVELWENVECSPSVCSNGQGGRSFSKVTDGTDALTMVPFAHSAVFVDFGENGIADILVLSRDSNGSESVTAVFNNFYNDAFFFKTLGLNGVCTTMCPTGDKFPSPKPYGVNFPGGTFKFTYTDLSGNTHIQIGAQLYSSSYMSLQTPYNLFGLGRTSNYVDQLFFGMPLNQTVHFNNWVGTIPNSQVVAIPYKPSNPTGWTLELFINPSGIFFWVLIAFFAAIILLSAISFALYRREKQQDIKMKQDQGHQFYFNAL
ncbi:hypothetical protein ACTA71_003450 [Dictyostelium dimigraforme]